MMQMLGQQDSPIPCICEGGGVLYTPRSDRTELLTDPIDPMPLRTVLKGAAFREEPGKITCYSVYPEEPDTIPTLHDRILSTGLSDRFNITVSSAAVDVTPKGIDKGSALRIVSERLGVGLDRVIAFGDSANDVAMLKVAGFSACPSNASEAARKASRYKSLHPSTLGLIDAMKHFIDTL
jgi:hydroxymethylpyrimidine pyrophosphatase-like HAD family hydrolase